MKPDTNNAIDPDVVGDLAPRGRLRVAINYGNGVLVQKDPTSGEPRGVAPALARELARRLGAAIEMVPFQAAGEVFDAAGSDVWDVCFLAIDPVRSAGILFSPPYVIIEGTYLVRDDSPLREAADVDRPGSRVAVSRGSAYDLFLTRALRHAEIRRENSGDDAFAAFRDHRLEALAGVRQALLKFAAGNPQLRVMSSRFMEIRQAMGTLAGRAAGARYLHAFVEEMKLSGFVAKALADSGQADASVAPPERSLG